MQNILTQNAKTYNKYFLSQKYPKTNIILKQNINLLLKISKNNSTLNMKKVSH